MSPDKNQVHILYVEDDSNLAYVTKENLERRGYKITLVEDGARAMQTFLEHDFHMGLIDIMLPNMDGITLVDAIRKINSNIPLLFISAKTMSEDRLDAFRVGGDDYIQKPYSMDELIFKIEVFIRRSNLHLESDHEKILKKKIEIGSYMFYPQELLLVHGNSNIQLTILEAELIKLLYENKNKVLSRNTIFDKVWVNKDYRNSRSLDVFVSRLRKYFSEDPTLEIKSVRGYGFKFLIHS